MALDSVDRSEVAKRGLRSRGGTPDAAVLVKLIDNRMAGMKASDSAPPARLRAANALDVRVCE